MPIAQSSSYILSSEDCGDPTAYLNLCCNSNVCNLFDMTCAYLSLSSASAPAGRPPCTLPPLVVGCSMSSAQLCPSPRIPTHLGQSGSYAQVHGLNKSAKQMSNSAPPITHTQML